MPNDVYFALKFSLKTGAEAIKKARDEYDALMKLHHATTNTNGKSGAELCDTSVYSVDECANDHYIIRALGFASAAFGEERACIVYELLGMDVMELLVWSFMQISLFYAEKPKLL